MGDELDALARGLGMDAQAELAEVVVEGRDRLDAQVVDGAAHPRMPLLAADPEHIAEPFGEFAAVRFGQFFAVDEHPGRAPLFVGRATPILNLGG